MDFFQRQEDARRRTTLLVVGYAAAVLLTVVAVYAVLAVVTAEDDAGWWQAELFFTVAAVLGVIIVAGTLYKTSALSAGGAKVAALLGARELLPDTRDADERRLLNVVEEMAIASGVPTPPVFVVETEEGINAFAAGFRPTDAVIGVTQGCVRQLTRDELQAVIAHEFSHILNGDMRLNIRLIGVLHGLLMIHLVGRILMRIMFFSGSGGSRRRSSSGRGGGDAKIGMALFVAGLAMVVIGAIGVLFGRLIKSAVSRQREYLADAAAVQFTRQPDGLAGALKRIGAASAGSRVRDPHAEELSHLFFANGLASSWFGLMATHPPLDERIRRIDPAFNGDYGSVSKPAPKPAPKPAAEDDDRDALRGVAALTMAAAAGAAQPPRELAMRPEDLSASIGTLDAGHLQAARSMLAALPDGFRERLHQPDDAMAVVLALLMSEQPAAAATQRGILEAAGSEWPGRVASLQPVLRKLDSSVHLAVIDLALPALMHLSPEPYRWFRQACLDFVAADGQMSVFEYALLGMIDRHLAVRFEDAKPPAIRYQTLAGLEPEAVVLLGVLARFGNETDTDEAARVFAAGLKILDPAIDAPLPDEAICSLEAFDQALQRFREAAMPVRQKLLHASAVCVAANGRVTVDEGNLLRAVADAFDAPMPPLVATAA